MNVALLIFAATTGVLAWGFLFAGAITFYDFEKPTIRGAGRVLAMVDLFVSLGILTMIYVSIQNWKAKPEARRLMYVGATCLAIAVCLFAATFSWQP